MEVRRVTITGNSRATDPCLIKDSREKESTSKDKILKKRYTWTATGGLFIQGQSVDSWVGVEPSQLSLLVEHKKGGNYSPLRTAVSTSSSLHTDGCPDSEGSSGDVAECGDKSA